MKRHGYNILEESREEGIRIYVCTTKLAVYSKIVEIKWTYKHVIGISRKRVEFLRNICNHKSVWMAYVIYIVVRQEPYCDRGYSCFFIATNHMLS